MKSTKHFVLIFLLMFLISCREELHSAGKLNSNSEPTPIKNLPDFQSTGLVQKETPVIQDTVRDFWQKSLDGNTEKTSTIIKSAPESFWESCQKTEGKQNQLPDKAETKRGMALDKVSITEKKNTFWSLKYFSAQIYKFKPTLLDVKVVRVFNNEAVVKIDWRKNGSTTSGISQLLLLHKDAEKWKIFMIPDPNELNLYNKDFGYEKKCNPE